MRQKRKEMVMSELAWVAEARKHIGLAEVAGKQHNAGGFSQNEA